MYSFAESPFLDERGDPVAVSLSNEPEFAAMEAAAV
jgi:hypothetical protein